MFDANFLCFVETACYKKTVHGFSKNCTKYEFIYILFSINSLKYPISHPCNCNEMEAEKYN